MLNSVKINFVYNFVFATPFDTINGIYKVMGIYGYSDILNINIDIKKETYDKLNIDNNIFNDHLNKFRTTNFYKLTKLDDYPDTIYYIPEFVIVGEPNASLLKAYDLGLAIKLGTWISKTPIENIKTEIEELILNRLGVNNNAIIYTINELLITSDEWNTITTNRDNNKEESDTLYQRYIKLLNENSNLKNKIQALENIIVTLSS